MADTLILWASSWEGASSWAAVAALFVFGSLVFVPRPAICVLAGLTFGLAAFPLALIAATAGTLLGFLLARYFFRRRLRRLIERRPNVKLLGEAVDADGWRLVFLLRIAPPIPATLLNYAFGLTGIKTWHYGLATAAGITPQVLTFVYLGSLGKAALDDRTVSSTQLMFAVAGFVVLLLVIAMVTRRIRLMLRARLANGLKTPAQPMRM